MSPIPPFAYQRIVLKLGTSVLTAGSPHLNRPRLLELVRQAARLHAAGVDLVVVSSGAIAAGRERLGHRPLPQAVPTKQMLAAVGQSRLMHHYEQLFDIYGVVVAQVLLTRADLDHRSRYLNARDTLQALLAERIVPIINENDAVATDEIKLGDNDTLSALVANLVEADLLLLLTDQPGLFTADPRTNPDAQLIPEVERIDDSLRALAGGSRSGLGTGGMVTKLTAADLARRGGAEVVIAAGSVEDVVLRVARGERIGTRFPPLAGKLESRKRWLLGGLVPAGRIYVDDGAARALISQGRSLLPVGITRVEGQFERGDTVRICNAAGQEIARGLTRYGAASLDKIKGHRSDEIAAILGYENSPEVVHRDDMVVL
ncbi:MAG: glutamate 5-kinase [Caldilineales bacterium]|nr:glutamate 5-kinase [Caldilineales bacterium]MDW8318147.1 glutamate 5-kinase [Anaerolineae bacterium]